MAQQDKNITILDIAEKANVSISTVSRVLSGNAKVAADKHQAVMRAVDEMNYRPNALARGLAGGQSMTIGVVTQDIGSPFYDAIMGGMIAGFAGTGYSPIFVDGQWQSSVEIQMLDTLQERRVDGMIVVGGRLDADVLNVYARERPVISVARKIDALNGLCYNIDNYQAAYEATTFLIDAGHRDIVHISGISDHQDAGQRQAGYMQALVDAGIEINPALIVQGNFIEQSGVLAVETLISQGQTFSAIFSANDQMAFGARLALFRRGIRVPDDVSIVGFDDDATSAYMTPPLTTMRQPAEKMGRAAADAMLSLLKGQPVEKREFVSRLVIRESVSRIR